MVNSLVQTFLLIGCFFIIQNDRIEPARGAKMIEIRVATPEDAAALVAIYAPYVKETTITFDYEVPSEAAFAKRITETLHTHPYFVAEDNGVILGYAYAHAYKERAAYDWAVEVSVYVDREKRGNGAGKLLYSTLEETLKKTKCGNFDCLYHWWESR